MGIPAEPGNECLGALMAMTGSSLSPAASRAGDTVAWESGTGRGPEPPWQSGELWSEAVAKRASELTVILMVHLVIGR